MNKLIVVSALMLTSVSAMALPVPAINQVPEPGMLPLLAAGAIAFFIARRLKK